MLKEPDYQGVTIEPAAQGLCDPECGCAPGSCAAAGFLPAYRPNEFRRNVSALNHALENFGFAVGVMARMTEEAFLLQPDEAF